MTTSVPTTPAAAPADERTLDQLLLRREQLLDTCAKDGVRDYNTLSDDALSELWELNRRIRQKNSGPPKRAKGVPATAEDLA